jgi:tetratricopeptide (TPR) repeat protein
MSAVTPPTDVKPTSDLQNSPLEDNHPTDVSSEPWTPERAADWNRYYDLYVVGFTLLAILILSCNVISDSPIWAHLAVGRQIAEAGQPAQTATASVLHDGERWINIPWLFQAAAYQLYQLGERLAPTGGSISGLLTFGLGPRYDELTPGQQIEWARQFAAGTLGFSTGLIALLTAWVLLRIRRPGPGAWWAALTTLIAFGAVPFAVSRTIEGRTVLEGWTILQGGIAGQPRVEPAAWALLPAVLTLSILLKATLASDDRPRRTIWLLPLLLAWWANLHESFVIGAIWVAACLPAGRNGRLGPLYGLPLLALCLAATLLNPSTISAWPVALTSLLDDVPIFGRRANADLAGDAILGVRILWIAAVALGLASFGLNRERFSLARLNLFLIASALFAFSVAQAGLFALVWAATMTLNGQEWWHRTFGEQARIDTFWTLWSTGGRALTLVGIIALMGWSLSGFGSTALSGLPIVGLGYDRSRFSFEAAEFLRDSRFEGGILNTNTSQGDALLWIGQGRFPTLIDSRPNLATAADRELIRGYREKLRDDPNQLADFFKERNISAIMIPAGYVGLQPRFKRVGGLDAQALNTYARLMNNPDFTPFYDDGNVVMFGRVPRRPLDVPLFDSQQIALIANRAGSIPQADARAIVTNRLDPNDLAFRRPTVVPTTPRPPARTSWVDRFFTRRFLTGGQPRSIAALRWLERTMLGAKENTLVIATPADCLLAIRNARLALATDPDDHFAYKFLANAYRDLLTHESALIAGIEPTVENAALLTQVRTRADLLNLRFLQRLTALNYAIQTAPPPRDQAGREDLAGLHFDLAQAYRIAGFVDLAYQHDRIAYDLIPPDARTEAFESQLGQIEQTKERIDQVLDQAKLAPNITQIDLANRAMDLGAAQFALDQLETAYNLNFAPRITPLMLMDLYCQIGQPDGASKVYQDLASNPDLDQAEVAFRQGRYRVLLGDYDGARESWAGPFGSITRTRSERVIGKLTTVSRFIKGNPEFLLASFVNQAEARSTRALASYYFNLGLVQLESGNPVEAGDSLTKALDLQPDLAVRPVMEYYLNQLGRPIPPAPDRSANRTASDASNDQPSSDSQSVSSPPIAVTQPPPATDTPVEPRTQPVPQPEENPPRQSTPSDPPASANPDRA